MLKGVLLDTEEVLEIVRNLTQQQEVIQEIFIKVRDKNTHNSEFSVYSETNFAKLLNQDILDLFIK
jgi:hypothetical protein